MINEKHTDRHIHYHKHSELVEDIQGRIMKGRLEVEGESDLKGRMGNLDSLT